MDTAKLESLIKVINEFILNPIIYFFFGLAVVYLLWGVVEFFLYSDNETKMKQSKSHMFWGLVGMFIMVSVYGIIRIIINTVKSF